MSLGDHLKYWWAKIGADPESAEEAQRRILRERAESMTGMGQAEEAVEMLARGGDTARAAALAERGGFWKRAGDLYESLNRPSDAARAYEKAQEWTAAGREYERSSDPRKAEECFRKAGRGQLGGFYERRGQFAQAAQTLEENGELPAAAALYEKIKNWDAAERCYHKAGRGLDAAAMFLRSGNAERAGRAYEEAGLPTKAADAYSSGNCHREALRLLGQMAKIALAQLRNAAGKPLDEARALARRAAGHAIALGEHAEAADLFERAGDLPKAAECWLPTKPAKAAELFAKVGDRERAAAAHEAAGDAAAAELLRAREQNPLRAAELLSEKGDHAGAAALLVKEGKIQEAAVALISGGRYLPAAQLLHAHGDLAGAAEAYEGAGMLQEAERLFRHSGDDDGLLRLYTRRGNKRELAKIYIRRKDFDAAIRALQALDQEPEVVALLAHCFRELKMAPQALIKFEEIVRREPLRAETLEVYYEYARLLEELGRKAEAIAVYDSVLAVSLDFGDVVQRLEKLKAPDPPPPPPVAPIPTDRFEVIEELDRGGQGIVWRARDRLLDRTVALKSIRETSTTRGLLNEARSMAALVHPHIVTLYEVFEQGGSLYLVLEFLKGETLLTRIKRDGPLPAAEAIRVVRAVCSALDFAHAKGLVHRDIKPSNIMLLEDGGVKVLDFGLAKAVESQELSSTQCGTPYYMAPEQILCRRPDARTDLYGLGATLYQALTGSPPFQGEDVFFQHLHCQPAPIRSLAPGVPMKLDVLVLRCLEKDPAYRPASAKEVAELLETQQ